MTRTSQARTIFIASAGHVVFAAVMIGLGVIGLVDGDFTPIWTGVPKSIPARELFPYVCAIVSLLSGMGLLWQRTAAAAARLLLIFFIVWLAVFRLPHAILAPAVMVNWWPCGESAVMIAGAGVLYVWFSAAPGDRGLRTARIFYGLGLLPLGIAHFAYLKETVSLVPGWLPAHVAWAYFTGAALIAAGICVIAGVFARLGATLSAWEMGLFTVIVWVPIIIAGANAFQWSEFVDSCALTAAAWVVADSFRRAKWFALRSDEEVS